MNWDEDLISPVKPAIDTAFRSIIDESCEIFKAEAAQASKEVIHNLDHTLKSMFAALLRYSTGLTVSQMILKL
jgi:hypothetical protein